MDKNTINSKFEEYKKINDIHNYSEIWRIQSEKFRSFWRNKILNNKTDTLSDAEIDEAIRILDRNAKGNTKESVAVAKVMIPNGAWRRMFREIKNSPELKDLLTSLFNESNQTKQIQLIDKIYEINKENKNSLTGESGNAVNAMLFAYNPDKYLAIVSLNDRKNVITAFNISITFDFDTASQGEKIILSNLQIFEGFKKIGISTTPWALSKSLYTSLKGEWKVEINKPESNSEESKHKNIETATNHDWIEFNGSKNLNEEVYEKVDKKGIRYFLDQINEETYLIPSFQREFVWNKEDVIELLKSLFRGYPIGSLLLCPINEYTKKFYKPKNFRYERKDTSMGYIILDGQQRLTSLFRAFTKEYVTLPENEDDTYYTYYVQISIRQTPDKTIERNHIKLWISAKEGKELAFKENNYYNMPLYYLYNNSIKLKEWISAVAADISQKWVIDNNTAYRMISDQFALSSESVFSFMENGELIPYIILTNKNSKDIRRVCDMFDKLNDQGVQLDDFDKISARLFGKDIDIRQIWYKVLSDYPLIKKYRIVPMDVIRTMSLIKHSNEEKDSTVQLKYIKRYVEDYRDSTTLTNDFRLAANAFNESLEFLSTHAGIISKKWIPRDPILITFSAVWYIVKEKYDRKLYSNLLHSLSKWYWCNVFNTTFDGNTIKPIANEFDMVIKWLEDPSDIPKSISQFEVTRVDFDEVYKSEAIYKGVMCLLLTNGIIDFFDGRPVTDYPNEIDDHHIYPEEYLKQEMNITEDKQINVIMNRTLIHKSTNRNKHIGKKSPKEYLSEVKNNFGAQKFGELCMTHLLDQDLMSNIYEEYDAFLKTRKERIMQLIKKAIE